MTKKKLPLAIQISFLDKQSILSRIIRFKKKTVREGDALIMERSIFEKILSKEIPSEIIYETERVFAINDINPVAPVHILIIPKMKIATINDVEEKDMDLIGEIVLTAKKLAFERGIQDSGYRLIWNTNGHGQQTVYHIHLHLIGGKQLSWNF